MATKNTTKLNQDTAIEPECCLTY